MIIYSLSWQWKDSKRNSWHVAVRQTGNVENRDGNNPDGDFEWAWTLCNEMDEVVWSGYHVGQLDRPPKLRDLLAEWQAEVNQVVIDGVVYLGQLEVFA